MSISSTFEFITEIEKLKSVLRKSSPSGLQRKENSAEHSWHVCMVAMALQPYANEPIEINHVLRMLLVHDIGEIVVGDSIIYESETAKLKNAEYEAFRDIVSLLDSSVSELLCELWLEFEAGETAEAKYARAIDRIPPIVQNLNNETTTWQEYNISFEQCHQLNSRIALGSETVWQYVETLLEKAKADGCFQS